MDVTGLWGTMQYAIDVEASAKWYADFLGIQVTLYDLPMFTWATAPAS
jgi:hypothetical protein